MNLDEYTEFRFFPAKVSLFYPNFPQRYRYFWSVSRKGIASDLLKRPGGSESDHWSLWDGKKSPFPAKVSLVGQGTFPAKVSLVLVGFPQRYR